MRGMFGIDRERLVNNLESLRRCLCLYDVSFHNVCDCKYSKDKEKITRLPSTGGSGFAGRHDAPVHLDLHGEGSTCPELRMVEALLATMTEEEYQTLCKRAGIELR